jgi:transposase
MSRFFRASGEVFCYNSGMQIEINPQPKQDNSGAVDLQQLQVLLAEKDRVIHDRDQVIKEQIRYIRLMEEQLRLAVIRRFAASSEKQAPGQGLLFDEAELEVLLAEVEAQLPAEDSTPPAPPRKQTRQRSFPEDLPRKQVFLPLTDAEKDSAGKTFYSKVKEELEYTPATLQVVEYWQEKAVVVTDGVEHIVAARRPLHPLGKCFAGVALLAHILVSKYADGLPLYRLANILQRYDGRISRSNMAHWIIRLHEVFTPLINLIKEVQRECSYLQADETPIQVLKETGKVATSDKWMWLIRGGPPGQPAVIFEYDPSRSGAIPLRLLDGFQGVLQADGYSGYNQICREQGITRIGCWDHVRRKFVDAIKAAGTPKKGAKPSKADFAVSHIRKLYAIEKQIKDQDDGHKLRVRQTSSLPLLAEFRAWLELTAPLVLKGSQTHSAINYALNQWDYLTGYCEDGKLHISNALAENAIRPFAIGRKSWLFADTPRGAKASATCYSLVQTAKANGLEPYAYTLHVLQNIAAADTVEKLEALLPWNVKTGR